MQVDVFRIGTLLEMAREIAGGLAEDGQRVKVCVQQAMGVGVFQGAPYACTLSSGSTCMLSVHLVVSTCTARLRRSLLQAMH